MVWRESVQFEKVEASTLQRVRRVVDGKGVGESEEGDLLPTRRGDLGDDLVLVGVVLVDDDSV